jgi:hypothetical protein
MFQPFPAVLDDLKLLGSRFDADALALLSYPDLHRAATGDAGDHACELEVVETERDARLAPWLTKVTLHTLQAHAEELRTLGMFEDVAIRLQAQVLEAMPDWKDLSDEAHAYFLIRCLRSHVDDPTDRISRLQMYLDRMNPQDSQLSGLKALLRMATDELLEVLHIKGSLDIKHVRRRFQGFEFLTKPMSSWERAVVASMALRGYSCTAGCFSTTHED